MRTTLTAPNRDPRRVPGDLPRRAPVAGVLEVVPFRVALGMFALGRDSGPSFAALCQRPLRRTLVRSVLYGAH